MADLSCIAVDENFDFFDISSLAIDISAGNTISRKNIKYAVMLRPQQDTQTGKKYYVKRTIFMRGQ